MESGINLLERLICGWGVKRGIIANSTPQAQTLKCVEEVGELASAVAKKNKEKTIDALGDVFVTLVMVAETSGVSMTECIEAAYGVIKDRTGHLTPEGVFVKDDEGPVEQLNVEPQTLVTLPSNWDVPRATGVDVTPPTRVVSLNVLMRAAEAIRLQRSYLKAPEQWHEGQNHREGFEQAVEAGLMVLVDLEAAIKKGGAA